jgi:putative oxygen-independent coproporphyrinogen III oxidase
VVKTTVGVYVHFPWCVRKCPYCDFNSHPLQGNLDEQAYLDALRADLKASVAMDTQIGSVFFGGGTPSLFSPYSFEKLLGDLDDRLIAGAEITMEANPGTTEHHDLAGYRATGINRLSLGAQSFDNSQLHQLGRIHDASDTIDSFTKARAAGFDNINLDLMYGLPRQTARAALTDLQSAFELAPEHISWYQLTIEPRTQYAQRPPVLASESAIDDMEIRGRENLASAGYQRYEVSAYARAGRASQHNMNYWSFGDYLGIGAGAHGKVSFHDDSRWHVVRTSKPRQPRLYLNEPTTTIRNPVAADDLIFEFMLNALRLREGVSFECFEQRTGLDRQVLQPLWSALVADGLVTSDNIATTARGYQYLDSVVQRFLS